MPFSLPLATKRRMRFMSSTVHTHTLHVYDKAGVSTRAAVALFAMEHDLVRA